MLGRMPGRCRQDSSEPGLVCRTRVGEEFGSHFEMSHVFPVLAAKMFRIPEVCPHAPEPAMVADGENGK